MRPSWMQTCLATFAAFAGYNPSLPGLEQRQELNRKEREERKEFLRSCIMTGDADAITVRIGKAVIRQRLLNAVGPIEVQIPG